MQLATNLDFGDMLLLLKAMNELSRGFNSTFYYSIVRANNGLRDIVHPCVGHHGRVRNVKLLHEPVQEGSSEVN